MDCHLDGRSLPKAGPMTMTEQQGNELKRIRWRCRRGMRELDQLLGRYLDREWERASEPERGVFLQILECEDDKLWRWFMGYEQCPDGTLASLIQRIRQLPA